MVFLSMAVEPMESLLQLIQVLVLLDIRNHLVSISNSTFPSREMIFGLREPEHHIIYTTWTQLEEKSISSISKWSLIFI